MHKLNITFQCFSLRKHWIKGIIREAIRATLAAEGISAECEINVLLTNDSGIREINRIQRQLDKATDVLSFPMFDLTPGNFPRDCQSMLDPETGYLPLGDMVISLERAKAQAEEYGHSIRREVGYLTVHSILHLLGYDHLDEGEMKRQMRAREESIMADIVLR